MNICTPFFLKLSGYQSSHTYTSYLIGVSVPNVTHFLLIDNHTTVKYVCLHDDTIDIPLTYYLPDRVKNLIALFTWLQQHILPHAKNRERDILTQYNTSRKRIDEMVIGWIPERFSKAFWIISTRQVNRSDSIALIWLAGAILEKA